MYGKVPYILLDQEDLAAVSAFLKERGWLEGDESVQGLLPSRYFGLADIVVNSVAGLDSSPSAFSTAGSTPYGEPEYRIVPFAPTRYVVGQPATLYLPTHACSGSQPTGIV